MKDRGALGSRGKVATAAGTPFLRALAVTWRYRFRNVDAIRRLRERGEPFIFSLWHGQLLPLLWAHRGQGVRVMISEHRDGEIIARIAESLGYRTVRGSTSKGGERALLALVRALEAGEEVAVTPDGPKGPAERYQPGALVAAARARAPIVPIAAHATQAWRLKSWDRFMIPKPFARLTVAYGDPVEIGTSIAREAATQGGRLEVAMRAALEDARR